MNFPFHTDLILENDFVLLRPIIEDDIEHLLSVAIADPELLQYSPFPIHNQQLLEAYVKRAIANRENETRYTFCVWDKQQKAYAGSTSFLNISEPDSRLEIGGTWYGKAFQRTGLNRNCKFLLLQYAFERLGAERVAFRTDERNEASRIAIEKIGGQFEGILRSHMVLHDGFRRNTACYSILKTEWDGLKETVFSPYLD